MFFCIKGFNVDRHDYVNEALEKGASALVVDHKVNSTLPQIVVDNTNEALSDMVAKFYDYPSKKMTMIGVTGTDGNVAILVRMEFVVKLILINLIILLLLLSICIGF